MVIPRASSETTRAIGMSLVHFITLERAVKIAGGIDAFAERADVAPHAVGFWLTGTTPPMRVFLIAVDVLTEHAFSKNRE